MMKFKSVILLNGKSATGIQVPNEIVEKLGSGKHPQVKVTINGFTYRSSVASMSGVFMLPISGDRRERAGVAAGDEVEVEIEVDNEPREVELPTDFATALEGNPAAKKFFDGLSYSRKSGLVLPIEQTKNPETRQRRIEKAISLLEAGKA